MRGPRGTLRALLAPFGALLVLCCALALPAPADATFGYLHA